MKRAVQTALLAASQDIDQSDSSEMVPLTVVFLPILREQVTYKNTVASSVSELERFVAELMEEFKIDHRLFSFSYLKLDSDDLWYL